MWLVGAFHTILKLPVTLWQFFSNSVCASWNFLDRKRSKKHSLTDLELMCLHDASFKLVRDRAYELCFEIKLAMGRTKAGIDSGVELSAVPVETREAAN
jgi:hypothetical protein